MVFATLNHGLAPQSRGRFERKPIVVKQEVWSGSHATIRGGATIGRGSLVAAGAVVTKDVPPMTILGGVPAKVLGSVPQEDV